MSFFLYQLLTLANLSVLILTSTSILQTGKGNSVLTSPHPLTLTASLLSKHSPFVTTHSVYLGHACQIKEVPYFLPIPYLFIFLRKILLFGEVEAKVGWGGIPLCCFSHINYFCFGGIRPRTTVLG